MSEPLIQFENLCFTYPNGRQVLNGVSLSVSRGEIFGLLGPNGAGKSTAFRVLVGLSRASSGAARLAGRVTSEGDRRVYDKVGYMPDSGDVFDNSTVEGLLRFFARCHRLDGALISRRIDELLERFQLSALRKEFLRTMSRGLKQQAHIMRCFIHDPDILVLDEPASNLDAHSRGRLLEILRQERNKGKAVLITSHILPELSNLCTHLGILKDGFIIDQGRVIELLDKHQSRVSTYHARVIGGMKRAIELLDRQVDSYLKGYRVLEPDLLSIEFAGASEDTAGLLQLLVTAGVQIIEFARQTKDIEQIYTEIVRH